MKRRTVGPNAILPLAACLALATLPVVAPADPLGGATWGTFALFLIVALLVLVGYEGAVWLVEALVLHQYLKDGFRQCLGYSAAMNLASLATGFLFRALFNESEGWALALLSGHAAGIVVLFVRSFATAMVVETPILTFLLRKRFPFRTALVGSLLANLASYALSAPLLLLLPVTRRG